MELVLWLKDLYVQRCGWSKVLDGPCPQNGVLVLKTKYTEKVHKDKDSTGFNIEINKLPYLSSMFTQLLKGNQFGYLMTEQQSTFLFSELYD